VRTLRCTLERGAKLYRIDDVELAEDRRARQSREAIAFGGQRPSEEITGARLADAHANFVGEDSLHRLS
jgi:hypothetical protein